MLYYDATPHTELMDITLENNGLCATSVWLVNAIVHRSLAAVDVPSTLEPIGLCNSALTDVSILPHESLPMPVTLLVLPHTFATLYVSVQQRELEL